MPALFTHYKFGHDVLAKLPLKMQKEINLKIEYYNIFNQAFDNLYYDFKWNYYKAFGINAHKKNVDKFFENLIIYIKDNNLQNNNDLVNMIYGFINHYTLDTLLHPYINYQVKNLGITHTKIEFMLDSKIRSSKKGKIYKTIIPTLNFSKDLKNLIDFVFEKTHNQKNIGKIFNRSHNNGYYLYRYFINDSFGIKTFFYKLIDIILPFKKFKLAQNTFYIPRFDNRLSNEKKEEWHHPNNKDEIYNYSYEELYNIALKICVKLNKDARKVLDSKKDLNTLIEDIKKIGLNNL